MKRYMIIVAMVTGSFACEAATTIDPASRFAYGANVGWMNAEADTTNGVVIGQAFCSGYLYGANVGWIHLGDGSPDNGLAYGNGASDDYGVNHDGSGQLTGYAYGANIGWLTFEQNYGKPRVNLLTGALSGYVWGANVGWISLSNYYTYVRTETIDAGPDTDMDTIPDAWEYGHTNILGALGAGDADDDGISDVDEYMADTDPFDAGDYLAITDFQVDGTTNRVTWPVKTSRLYTLQHTLSLGTGTVWVATSSSFIPPYGPDVIETVGDSSDSNRYYRVRSQLPLSQ